MKTLFRSPVLSFLGYTVICYLFISSCDKISSSQLKCSGSLNPCPQEMEISLNGESLNFVAQLLNIPQEVGFGILNAHIDNQAFQKLENLLNRSYYNKLDEKTKNLASTALVIYYDIPNGEGETINHIQFKDIKGFSSYKFISRKLHHEFFLHKDGMQFEWYKGLSAYTSKLTYDHMNAILRTITSDNHPSRGYILLVNKEAWITNRRLTKDGLTKITENFEKRNNTSNLRDVPTTPGEQCSSPCVDQLESPCIHNPEMGYDECDRVCTLRLAHELAETDDETLINNSIIAYSFRDDFLIKSPFGLDYLQYYELLSEDTENNLTASLALEMLDLLVLCNPSIIEVLKPNASQSSYILISPEISTKAKSIISQYKNLTSDTDVLDVLAVVEQDIDKYVGQPASFVLNDCCSN